MSVNIEKSVGNDKKVWMKRRNLLASVLWVQCRLSLLLKLLRKGQSAQTKKSRLI
ncbi:MAG: hypothetical protein OSJ62_08595 [Lachnospiraceae bacterium]|nr:hypothetical protein [Lachnospiraceae bacterium]